MPPDGGGPPRYSDDRVGIAMDDLDELDPLTTGLSDGASSTSFGLRSRTKERIHYDDRSTIDWPVEHQREKRRRLALESDDSRAGKLAHTWDRAQIWIIVGATGVVVGVLAGCIDVVTMWLGDLKEGVCSTSYYSSKQFCCLGLAEDVPCSDWLRWHDTFSLKAVGGGYVVDYLAYVILTTSFAATAAYLVCNYAPYASHSGIPEVKALLSGVVIRHFAGKWTLLIKTVGLCLAVSSGLWLGKEGPLVHIAVCVSSICMKFFPAFDNEARRRDVFTAASAAGMAVAFGAPIGGVLFALEQISYFFPDRIMWQSFVCAMVASVSLQAMNPFRTGKLVRYEVIFDRDWKDFEIVPFAFLGLVGGIYGAFFIRLNRLVATTRMSTRLKDYPISEIAALAFATAIISFPNIFARVQGARVLTDLLQECSQGNWLDLCTEGKLVPSVLLLLSCALLGTLLSAVTFGARIPAGIMLPTLIVGAALGRSLGMLMQQWHRSFPGAWLFLSCTRDGDCVTPGVYAVIGAAAALSGVTRMTVSLVVIMFELTGALTFVLPIMISVMVAKWTGDFLSGPQGVYELWIELREFDVLDKEESDFHGLTVRDIMMPMRRLHCIYATGDNTIESLQSLLKHDVNGFPLLSDREEAVLLGYVPRNKLRHALATAVSRDSLPGWTPVIFTKTAPGDRSEGIGNGNGNGELESVGQALDLRSQIDVTPLLLTPGSNVKMVANLFQQMGLRYVFIGARGKPQGLITKRDLLTAARARRHGDRDSQNGEVFRQEEP